MNWLIRKLWNLIAYPLSTCLPVIGWLTPLGMYIRAIVMLYLSYSRSYSYSIHSIILHMANDTSESREGCLLTTRLRASPLHSHAMRLFDTRCYHAEKVCVTLLGRQPLRVIGQIPNDKYPFRVVQGV